MGLTKIIFKMYNWGFPLSPSFLPHPCLNSPYVHLWAGFDLDTWNNVRVGRVVIGQVERVLVEALFGGDLVLVVDGAKLQSHVTLVVGRQLNLDCDALKNKKNNNWFTQFDEIKNWDGVRRSKILTSKILWILTSIRSLLIDVVPLKRGTTSKPNLT